MSKEPMKETRASEAPPLPSARTAFPEGKGNDDELFPYSVQIGDVYDGPLDLLLGLIKKQNLDIRDLPIGKITAQFLAYVRTIPAEEADAAAEFCYMASQLIVIKSRMLLPIERTAAANGAAEDPRQNLIERLLEYEQVKQVAQTLAERRSTSRQRGPDRMPTMSGLARCAARLHRRLRMQLTFPASCGGFLNRRPVSPPSPSATMPSWSVI